MESINDILTTVISIGGVVTVLCIAYRTIRKADDAVESVCARKEENTLIMKGVSAALNMLILIGNGATTQDVKDSQKELQDYLFENRK